MPTVTLGRTQIAVEKNAFGALPIQRLSKEEAGKLLRKAYDHGIRFFDTARGYSDSEEKLGDALSDVRGEIFIATKTHAKTAKDFWEHLAESLRLLKTDYIDIYQLHNPAFCPMPGGEDGLYDAMREARQQGKIRFIGLTNHRLAVAQEAVASGLYDTLQFPLSYLSSPQEEALARACQEAEVGFLGMKALSGGLITNAEAAYAYLAQFEGVLPLWGIQKEQELDQFIQFLQNPPAMTPLLESYIQQDRQQLSGSFCRGCGYCMPCAAGIEINNCARMSLLLRRSPSQQWLSGEWQGKMEKIDQCTGCGQCKAQCPYGLDTPALLRENLQDYRQVLAGEIMI